MKTSFLSRASALLVAALLPLTATAAESPSLLLQKGIYAEEVERNLDSAIKIYEQIAAESATNRAVVAQAQFRLAVCYQKQGNKEQAIKLLNDLLKQFPSEGAQIQMARETLRQLGAPVAEDLKLRELPRLEASWVSAISPDGRFIGFMPKNSPDICVYETATGKTWKIATCDPADRVHDKFFPIQDGKFSPDGKSMAYVRYYSDESKSVEVWVAKLDGSGSRKLYQHERKGLWVFMPLCWSPDSSKIMMVLWEEKTSLYESLVALDSVTGETNEIKRVYGVSNGGLEFNLSWNGQLLALFRKGGELDLVDLKSGREETLVDRDVYALVGWSSDNARYVYLSNRTGDVEIWAIGIDGGRASGSPQFLGKLPEFLNFTRDELTSLGVSHDGNVYVLVDDKGIPWMAEGLLADKVIPSSAANDAGKFKSVELPRADFVGPNHSIWDRKFGFSFIYPDAWVLQSAIRRGSRAQTWAVDFVFPATGEVQAWVIGRAQPDPKTPALDEEDKREAMQQVRQANAEIPNPKTTEQIDSWLRRYTQIAVDSRMGPGAWNAKFYSGFENHPETFVFRTINGRRALTSRSSFTRNGVDKDWQEYRTCIYTETVLVHFVIVGPAAKVDDLRPAFDKMVETFRLP